MDKRQNMVVVMLFVLLAGLSAWLQFGLLERPARVGAEAAVDEHDRPNYYVENLVSTGINRHGKKYRLSADRLVHYPLAQRASLLRPHLIQYSPAGASGAPRHIYADSGWLYDARAEVLLSGNVKVVQNHSGDLVTDTATTETMLIHLKDDPG